MRLFKRKWRVSVGAKSYDDFDGTFSVKLSLGSKPNTCTLKLYGLSDASAGSIAHGDLVRLEAGYEQGMTLLFAGDVRKLSGKKDGVDSIVELDAGDGESRRRNSRVLRSFAATASVDSVVSAIADAMGVGAGNSTEAVTSLTLGQLGRAFPSGVALDGPAVRELTRVTRSLGLEWSVQNGVLQLLGLGRSLNRTAVRLSSDSGLLNAEISKGRLKAEALLIPDLVPGRKVLVDSPSAQGVFRIDSAEYSGDTKGEDWTAKIDGVSDND